MTNWLPPLPPEPFDQVARRERTERLLHGAQLFNDLSVFLVVFAALMLVFNGFSRAPVFLGIVSIIAQGISSWLEEKAHR